MSETVRLTEGDAVTWTFTAKTDGTADNLTGKTVALLVHLDGSADGTNLVDYAACTVTDEDNGVFTFDFTTPHTANPGRGYWRARVTTTATSKIRHKKAGQFIIERNSGAT